MKSAEKLIKFLRKFLGNQRNFEEDFERKLLRRYVKTPTVRPLE